MIPSTCWADWIVLTGLPFSIHPHTQDFRPGLSWAALAELGTIPTQTKHVKDVTKTAGSKVSCVLAPLPSAPLAVPSIPLAIWSRAAHSRRPTSLAKDCHELP